MNLHELIRRGLFASEADLELVLDEERQFNRARIRFGSFRPAAGARLTRGAPLRTGQNSETQPGLPAPSCSSGGIVASQSIPIVRQRLASVAERGLENSCNAGVSAPATPGRAVLPQASGAPEVSFTQGGTAPSQAHNLAFAGATPAPAPISETERNLHGKWPSVAVAETAPEGPGSPGNKPLMRNLRAPIERQADRKTEGHILCVWCVMERALEGHGPAQLPRGLHQLTPCLRHV